ncbi:hypothetical protein [Gordonia sp. 'Campus']|uniref:hypothetical protein n=1 Tax=Gordonia sp. 'Campus' TaxID=2915824 RepID=UPI0027DEBEB4|nr:hypothetical protein [Gordonia sp. 'Campus']
MQRRVDARQLTRLWPGAMADRELVAGLARIEQHRLTVLAAAAAGEPGRIFSHVSAAAIHGLPMLSPDVARVHVTSPKVGKRSARVMRHQAVVASEDVMVVDGVCVTSVERTACDVARLGTSRQALVVLDSALAAGADPDRLAKILESSKRFKGVETLRRMLPMASKLSESVGESLSRAVMFEIPGIPIPRQQVTIGDDSFTARVDFLLAGTVIGEFDGMVKYSGALGGDKPAWQTVVEEKAREDKLRALGYTVVRWTWRDLQDKAAFAALLTDALRIAGAPPFANPPLMDKATG